MTTLDRTFTLIIMNDVSKFIAEHLNLNVARTFDKLFDIDIAIIKGIRRFGLCHLIICLKFFFFCDDTHSPTTAACDGFNDHRITNLLCDVIGISHTRYYTLRTGHHRHTGFFHCLFGASFVAHRLDHLRRWSDKCKTG